MRILLAVVAWAAVSMSADAQDRARTERHVRVSGRLIAVPAAADSDPPYVIRDKRTGVAWAVSPVGVDLERLVGDQVSVSGAGKFNEVSGMFHLRATRATPAAKSEVTQAQYNFQDGSGTRSGPMLSPPQRMSESEPGAATPNSSQPEELPSGTLNRAVEIPAMRPPHYGSADEPYPDEFIYDEMPAFAPRMAWAHIDFPIWWTDGMTLPPLVISNAAGARPALPNDTVLFGGNDELDESRTGVRVRLGSRLTTAPGFGVEAEYLRLGEQSLNFSRSSGGTASLGFSFFNLTPFDVDPNNNVVPVAPREDSFVAAATAGNNVITFPQSGAVAVDARSSFDALGILIRRDVTEYGPWAYFNSPDHRAVTMEFVYGYRFLRLEDELNLSLQTVAATVPTPTSINLRDTFRTRNHFHGVNLGVDVGTYLYNWTVDASGRLALGQNNATVEINGSGSTAPNSGGMYARRTNIGTTTSTDFVVVPELGVTGGYCVTDQLRFTLGYSLIYWSRVMRAGDQIDRDISSTQLTRPERPMTTTSYWASGLNLGLDYWW